MLAVCAALAPASAGGGTIRVDPRAPFSADDLAEALSLRLPAGSTVPMQVSLEPDHRVVVRLAGVSRAVDIRGLDGHDAARRVALACLDLMESNRAAAPAAAPDASLDASLDARQADFGGPPALAMALVGRSGAGLGVELQVPLGWIAMHGHADLLSRTASGNDRFRELPVRLGAGVPWRRGRWSAMAALDAIAAPHWIEAEDGDRTYAEQRLRFGGGATASLSVELTHGVGLIAIAALDIYATRQRYLVGSSERFDTGRVEPWAGAGLQVDLGGGR